MLLTESFGALDYILCHTLTGGLHMARRKFLTETGGAARLNNIHHIALRRVRVVRIAAFEITACGAASSVIIHYERILFVRVKIRR